MQTSQSTIETLRTSMLNLSKSDVVHYEVTQQSYLLTMSQLMAAEGIEAPTIDQQEYAIRFEKLRGIEKEITKAVQYLENTRIETERLKMKKSELEADIEELSKVKKSKQPKVKTPNTETQPVAEK